MKFISDFHIHSHYAMATSKNLVPEYLEYWARIKGIDVIGTGDCIHPGWVSELREKLEPCDNGLFRLKEEYRLRESKELDHDNIPHGVFFMLTGELSSIYKKGDRVRKVHNVCIFPDFEALLKVQGKLDRLGNIRADGRPILGIDSRDILEMTLHSHDYSYMIPAHIWTPWFSVLGSKSGFDSIEECFEDLTDEIFALETGLSSDPPMNWSCSFLDRFRLVSNSDAHSPEKLGREANLFNCELSYEGIYNALKYDRGFEGTIEFFPEEGKYHLDGHRKCGIVWTPEETLEHEGICPVCGHPVTRGVLYRVTELSDRAETSSMKNQKPFYSITQLPDLLAEMMNVKSSSSKKVQHEYFRLIRSLGSEFHIYLNGDMDEIKKHAGELCAEGIKRLRSGEVNLQAGYDGVFGKVKVFPPGGGITMTENLFGDDCHGGVEESPELKIPDESPEERGEEVMALRSRLREVGRKVETEEAFEIKLNDLQQRAVQATGTVSVIAGPGSGKTRVLIEKILYIDYITEGASRIAAVTFSNRAAGEIEERLKQHRVRSELTVGTFHALGSRLLGENLSLVNRHPSCYPMAGEEVEKLLRKNKVFETKKIKKILEEISAFKQGLSGEAPGELQSYEKFMQEANLFDLDDLIYLPVKLMGQDSPQVKHWPQKFSHILVDEFQDINPIQYDFLKLLSRNRSGGSNRSDIFIIGDVNQAIYGFRGSDARLIYRFKEDFAPLQEIALEESYRCGETILRASSAVVNRRSPMRGHFPGKAVEIHRFPTHGAEAEFIASQVEKIVGGVRSHSMDRGTSHGGETSVSPGDIAILCRSTLIFPSLIKALEQHAIPYQVCGSTEEILFENFRKALREVTRAMAAPGEQDEFITVIESSGDLSERFMNIMEYLDLEYDSLHLETLLEQYDSMEEVLAFTSLNLAEDSYSGSIDALSLMTIHASKGLEFDTVFIPGFEEGLLPFNIFGNCDMDEERRIAYVAMTRARQELYISSCEHRVLKNRKMKNSESRFLKDIPSEVIIRKGAALKKEDRQLKLF